MPTQLDLQNWLRGTPSAYQPQSTFREPAPPDVSYLPPQARQEAGYTVPDMGALQAAGVSPARAAQLLGIQEDALKKIERQRFESNEKKWMEAATQFNPSSPTYLEEKIKFFKSNPEAARSSVVGNLINEYDSVWANTESAKNAEASKRESAANRIEGKNAQIETVMGKAGFAPQEVEFFKDKEGAIPAWQQGSILQGVEQKNEEIRKAQEIQKIGPMLADQEASFASAESEPNRAMIKRQYIKAQQDAGVPPDQIRHLAQTSLGPIPATSAQLEAAKSYKPSDEEKAAWLTEQGIDVSTLDEAEAKRAWAKAYDGVQDMALEAIVSGKTSAPTQPAAPSNPPTINSPEEAAKLPSGTIFVDSTGKRRRVP